MGVRLSDVATKASTLTGSERLEVTQSGSTRYTDPAQIAEYANSLVSFIPGRITGRFYTHSFATNGSVGGLTQDRLFAIPAIIGASKSFDRIALVTTGTAGTTCRLGIYADSNGRPGSLIVDAGTVDTSGFGQLAATISVTLSGVVWLACVSNGGAAAVGRMGNHVNPMIGNSDFYSNGTAAGYSQNGITGALPSSWGTTYNVELATSIPQLFLRAA